jgi:hypothetical protein
MSMSMNGTALKYYRTNIKERFSNQHSYSYSYSYSSLDEIDEIDEIDNEKAIEIRGGGYMVDVSNKQSLSLSRYLFHLFHLFHLKMSMSMSMSMNGTALKYYRTNISYSQSKRQTTRLPPVV